MHMLMITIAGLVLLAVFVGIGHLRGDAAGRKRAARAFVPAWFVLALINVTIGVVSAGYTVLQEAPVFVVTFGIPAALAWWLARRSA
ncbi:MAG: hypothetical protein WBA25_10650 [Jannaschia sp.]